LELGDNGEASATLDFAGEWRVKLSIDTELAQVVVDDGQKRRELPLASADAFAAVSTAWLRAGWDVKHIYSFTWLGRPIIQLPEDMFRLQEVIYRIKPDVIIECGVAHGGSLVFYAGLCRLMGKGRVIGVDIEIRPHNRAAIEAHPLFDSITLIEADSKAPDTIGKVKALIPVGATVMVFLDSNHTRAHVRAELEGYGPLVTPGSYIVAMDGIMTDLVGAPRSRPDWDENNPGQAMVEWVAEHPDFVIEEPAFAFNEGLVRDRVTYWPNAFARRLR
jgi:cephalosporin hydroxylase